MQEGIIAGLVKDKGFGFIKVDGSAPGAKDLFFHSKDVEDIEFDSLVQGDRLTFELADGPKGPYAAHVKKV